MIFAMRSLWMILLLLLLPLPDEDEDDEEDDPNAALLLWLFTTIIRLDDSIGINLYRLILYIYKLLTLMMLTILIILIKYFFDWRKVGKNEFYISIAR